jgi:hypothetical protein
MLTTPLTLLWRRLSFIVTAWQTLVRVAGNPYRPELHYMRGPGPKWRAKRRGHTA